MATINNDMTEEEVAALPEELRGDFAVDLDDTEELCVSMTKIAHEMTVLNGDDNDGLRATGRALKSMIPGWISFIDEEKERVDGTPSNAVYGLTRAMGFLLSMGAMGFSKDGPCVEDLKNTILELIDEDMDALCGSASNGPKPQSN